MKKYSIGIIVLLLCIGAFFRLFGINWDGRCCMHPDERAIIMYTLPLAFPNSINEFFSTTSPLNPHFFAYGNFPLYLLKASDSLVSLYDPRFLTYDYIQLVGRFISSIADLLTVLFIFFITKRIWNKKIALLSSFFYTLAVFPIQASHFFTVDTLLTTLITLTLYLLLRYYDTPSIKIAILVGISFGLSLATKVSALPLLFSIFITLFLDITLTLIRNKRLLVIKNHIPVFVKKTLLYVLLILLSTAITFALVQPYAIIDLSEFIKQNQQQAQMTKDAFVFPYTLQYVGIPRYIYQLQNVFLWGIGPLISFFSLGGFVLIIKNLAQKFSQKEKSQEIILLSFFVIYFSIVGSFAVGWMRYMLPVYPLFCIFAGVGLYSLLVLLRKFRFYIMNISLLIIIALTFIWPLSFMHIYTQPNTRLQATNWIHKNVPPQSQLAIEHWDDALPIYDSQKYIMHTLTLYDPDTPQKWNMIRNILSSTDYIILASHRLYLPLQKLTDCDKLPPFRCYKETARYYKNLFDGSLGFKKVAEFAVYPTIPFTSIQINDQGADEAFTVYDHPKVIIFKNTKSPTDRSHIQDDFSMVYY